MQEIVIIDALKDVKTFTVIVVIVLLTIFISGFFNKIFQRYIKSKLESGLVDVTGYRFLGHVISAIILIIGIGFAFTQVSELAVIGHSLLAGAGIISLAAGIASQQTLGNIISGVMIIIFKPFRINDTITINDNTGTVEDINLRQVILKDHENNRIIIPNSIVGSQIIINKNINDARSGKTIEIGIGYNSDIDKALKIMQDEVSNHRLFIDIRTEEDITNHKPLVKVKVVELGTYAVKLKAWIVAKNADDAFEMYCDLLQSIKKRFETEGIELPYPQQVINLKKQDN